MSIYKYSLRHTVQQTTSDSPERWLERLQRLKRDTRLLEQVGTLPQSGRQMRAEGQDRWQVRLALLRQDPRLVERFTAFQRQLAALPRRARRWLVRKAALTMTAAALLLALSSAPLVYAAGSITVSTTDPTVAADGQCSLMEAIYNANADAAIHADCAAGSGADTIILPMGSTIRLTSTYNGGAYQNGLPKITSQVTIEGNGSTILADGNLSTLRVLMVELGDLTLNNTTISGGRIAPFSILGGGGLLNIQGNLTLNHSTVSGNTGSAGIWSNGQMTLHHSTVSGNTDGGIWNNGTLTLNESTVSDNGATFKAGGIYNGGVLTLNESTVSGNSLMDRGTGFDSFVGDGAGIFNAFRSTLTLNNSTVSGNTISGRTLPDSYEFHAARGGGIYNFYGTVTLNNSTISGNSVSSSGDGTLGLSGGGIYMAGGTLNLSHSLVSGNAAQNSGREIFSKVDNIYRSAIINSNDFNLIGHDGNAGTVNFTPSGSDIVPSQPLSAILSPLADNGGPTLTHALLTGSPALDAVPTGPATDQRGVSRPQGATFDIGAFELEQQALFNFSGFFQPVDNLPTLNTVKAGQGVPVKFSLSGNQGLEIFTEGYPVSQQVACAGGLPVDDIEQTVTTGGSSLSYDPATDSYTYVWKTNSSWKGQCRTLIVKLSDGTEHIANFKFK